MEARVIASAGKHPFIRHPFTISSRQCRHGSMKGARPSIITGLLKTGAVSAGVPLRLWNAQGGQIVLKMANVKITVALDNGAYSGGIYPQGQEVVDGKWIELKSSGIVGSGITDDSQSSFTPIGGPPASGGLSIGDIPANSARIIFLRLNLPASPLTLFAATPRLLVSCDVLE